GFARLERFGSAGRPRLVVSATVPEYVSTFDCATFTNRFCAEIGGRAGAAEANCGASAAPVATIATTDAGAIARMVPRRSGLAGVGLSRASLRLSARWLAVLDLAVPGSSARLSA